jgi:hypothetical protein
MNHATRKAIQNALRGPCLGWVLLIVETIIPANPGPQADTKARGNNRNWFRFRTALQVNPSPQEIAKAMMKKAVT